MIYVAIAIISFIAGCWFTYYIFGNDVEDTEDKDEELER